MATAKDPVQAKLAVIKACMPETYKSIQAKAQEVGGEAYALVRRALRGEANCFYALEAGHVMGAPFGQQVMAEMAVYMVQYGVGFMVIWPASVEAADGTH